MQTAEGPQSSNMTGIDGLDGFGLLALDPRPSAVIGLDAHIEPGQPRYLYRNKSWEKQDLDDSFAQSSWRSEKSRLILEDLRATDQIACPTDEQCWFVYPISQEWMVVQFTGVFQPANRSQISGAAPLDVEVTAGVQGSGVDGAARGGNTESTPTSGKSSQDPSKETQPRLGETTPPAVPLNSASPRSHQATDQLERLLKMVEMSEVGVFEYNTDGVLLQANDAFYSLSAHPRDNSRSYAWVDSTFEEDRPALFEHWNTIGSGSPASFQMRWKRPAVSMPGGKEDTEGQWVLAACVPIMDDDGQVKSIAGCITDMTHQKKSQDDALQRAEAMERALASEQRFARFAELANVAIWIMDPDRKMQYCNDEWFRLCGISITDISSITWEDVLPPTDLVIANQQWQEITDTCQPSTFEVRTKRTYTDADGIINATWCLVSAYAELNPDGSVKALAGTLADISSFKYAEDLQLSRLNQAIESKRQQENFIDITSHEIRNPLGAVIHSADFVLDALQELKHALIADAMAPATNPASPLGLIDGSLDAVRTIVTCSSHQQRIIEDTLTVSKLDSKFLKIVPLKVDPLDILAEVRALFAEDAKKTEIDLQIVREKSLANILSDNWAMLDKGRIMQILINLVTNAIKFTKQETHTRRVTIAMGASRCRPTESDLRVEFHGTTTIRDNDMIDVDWGHGESIYLSFSVEDTGCGLDHDQASAIFTRFSQGSPRTYSKYGGSGLGLYISRELTELQGGEIGMASRPGIGSTFGFFVKARLTSRENLAAPTRPPSLPNALYSILVVEDNIINQKVLCNQLGKLGHTVHVASHGQEALDFLQTTQHWDACKSTGLPLHLILMDIEMPVMNGLDCARKIRELELEGRIITHVPIIAVSANVLREQMEAARASGMDDTISKPFRIVDLLPMLNRLAIQGAS